MGGILQNQIINNRKTTARQKEWFNSRKDKERGPNIKHEENLQKQVCRYLKLQYPSVVFRSDNDSGRWQYSRNELHKKVAMQSQKSWPDLFIYEPRKINKNGEEVHYCGMALELKKEGTTVIVKIGERKGRLSTDKHIQEQAAMLKGLLKKGYYANFAVGFDEAVKLIDWYMGKPDNGQLF